MKPMNSKRVETKDLKNRLSRNFFFAKDKKLRTLNPVKYFFVIGSSKFLLDNEPLEEILRERIQQYAREKKTIDFWIIKSPKFLNSLDLIDVKNKLTKDGLGKAELSAIVSLDEVFIKWMKLRLQNVAESNFMVFANDNDIESPLASENL
uniref:Ycf54 n=1 Tax=Scytosiphon lomentaria TaxID=27967 RepID=A0A7T8G5L3_SCYLO|nr:Ycf54 [Scytosiphon lomentaria]QQP22278.1 Ycf54 [Scytosiphon lomentaria]